MSFPHFHQPDPLGLFSLKNYTTALTSTLVNNHLEPRINILI